MSYRLGLDLGSTSIGWCLLGLDRQGLPASIIDAGVRIFPDGREDKSKEPLSVTRRNARGMRRNRDRRLLRRKKLMSFLIHNNLMPKTKEAQKKLEAEDPYDLRARAANEKVTLYELGRALFHINQRRGFKSNLKTDKGENDLGALKGAIRDLDAKLMATNSKTLGEYFAKQHSKKLPVRVHRYGEGSKAEYNFYTGREMYEKEVEAVLNQQTKHHASLTLEICDEIKKIIFYQRDLLPPEIGKCTFDPKEERARKACPTTQLFRIYQEVNNLSVVALHKDDPILTDDHRQKIIEALLKYKHRTFGQLKTLLKFGKDVRFSLESEKRDRLDGAFTDFLLRSKEMLGEKWDSFSPEQKDSIIIYIFEAQEKAKFVANMAEQYSLNEEESARLLEIKNKLPEGYGRISLKVMGKILPFLKEGLTYAKAAEKGGYHHSDPRTGEYFDKLPYYGQVMPAQVMGGTGKEEDFPQEDRKGKINLGQAEKFYGKINNPTVHIVLNQVHKLINEIIKKYGRPEQIVVELARDLKQPTKEINKQQAENKKENDRINKELEGLGVKQNYRNRMLVKLWEDLAKDPVKRCCPFSGKQIAIEDIFSGRFEEEHLLPFSRSYNDGRANKVLSDKDWNKRKNNRSPYEAFGHEDCWPDILARVQNLPMNKQWRFLENAWEKMEGKDGAIARLLNDTRYMSKAAKTYLSAIFDIEKGKSNVWPITGQMTALVRKKLGLNDLLGEEDGAKERGDHRHHVIDAFVIALTDRGMIKALSDQARRVETTGELWEKRHKLIVDMKEPFEEFREQLKEKIDSIIVSFKPDRGNAQKAIQSARPYTTSRLHEDTALRFLDEIKNDKGKPTGKAIMAKRVPLDSLAKMKNVEEVGDARIRQELLNLLAGLKENGKEWKLALQEYTTETGTRRVRLHIEKNMNTLVGISSSAQKNNPYKYYATGGNYCVEIYCPKEGKFESKWKSEVVSIFDAHKKGHQPQWKKDYPTAKLIMRLQINDMVAYEEGKKTIICRVKKIIQAGPTIYLRPHIIAEEEKDKLSWGASANQMMLKNARKISVDIIGRVRDPEAKTQAS